VSLSAGIKTVRSHPMRQPLDEARTRQCRRFRRRRKPLETRDRLNELSDRGKRQPREPRRHGGRVPRGVGWCSGWPYGQQSRPKRAVRRRSEPTRRGHALTATRSTVGPVPDCCAPPTRSVRRPAPTRLAFADPSRVCPSTRTCHRPSPPGLGTARASH
jgi:hypothetical protein